jgi:hypothetical protein
MIIEAAIIVALQAASPGEFKPALKINPYALCSCANADRSNLVAFTGVANDAQMTLGPDGRTAIARQATIFRVLKGKSENVPDPAKVFHVTDPAKCGVKFDYGKRYDVVAVKKPNGELETSYCVMPKPPAD